MTLALKLKKTVLWACGGPLLASALPAWAQEAPPAATQRVEITGSSIRRLQSETASPVQTLTREAIEKSGKASVAELLQTLAVDNQGSVPATFSAGFAAGGSGISLRGLGASSTLVLLNGRRIAPYGLADDGQKLFADLSTIPMEAVDRIEVVKDGASAIYGSDAIAGVVNIILRRDFVGTVFKAVLGQAAEGDGREQRLAITHGLGAIEADGFNLLFNLEFSKRSAISNRSRNGRGAVGRGDLRDFGFSAQEGLGGAGAIIGQNAAGSAINGNVRNPDTLDYYNRGDLAGVGFTRTFAGAACGNFTQHPQGDPGYNVNRDADGNPVDPFIQSGRGCLIDAAQLYGQISPKQQSLNLFSRGTLRLTPDLRGYAELNLYKSELESSQAPSGVSGSVGFPPGVPVINSGVSLGAAHPDNPYFGRAARLRYLAGDVGPRTSEIEGEFTRAVLGVKGILGGWDFDSGLLLSQNRSDSQRGGFLQRDVAFALLNPTAANVAAATAGSAAYAALPAGTLWRIGESAGLNSRAMYDALSPTISSSSRTRTAQLDVKASGEVFDLPGGPASLALGAEVRRESVRLRPVTGTERGNIIGLGYSAYDGARNIAAVFGELLAPLHKTLELSAALRADHYSDAGDSATPKLGLKWTPTKSVALRGTASTGFRAPSPAENGDGGLAAFAFATDPVRCNLGVQVACSPGSTLVITAPNPQLEPEKSQSFTLGLLLEPTATTSVALDLWQIKRKNEINQEAAESAILAGRVLRDPTSATQIPGDPGALVAVLGRYVNSTRTTVQGVDLDLRQAFALGDAGRLSLDLKWTHLFKWERIDPDGSRRDFAGTHGNCDVTNCMGTPADRANFGVTWELGAWRVATTTNYRASIDNVLFKDDPNGCASHFADGRDAPDGCKLKSFTTVDLSLRWKASKALELFGTVQNLFDKEAPLDPLTYGATAYNPLDHSGAVGRFFSVGLKFGF
jgi:iron complex outermembrane recepter protein